jgi:hypothetical protein
MCLFVLVVLKVSTNTSTDMASNSKYYYWIDTWLKFWWWCFWLTNLTLSCMITDIWQERTTSYITSKGVPAESKDEADGEGCPRLQRRWKFGEWWNYFHFSREKQMSATNISLHQFNGDKTGDRCLHFLHMTVLNSFFFCSARVTKMTHRDLQLLTFSHMYLNLNSECGQLVIAGFQNHKTSQWTGMYKKKVSFVKFSTAHYQVNTETSIWNARPFVSTV